jgi:hypothetical protein
MLSLTEKEEMYNVYKAFSKPPLSELNRGLIKEEKPIEYEPKRERNPLEDYVEKKTKEEFNNFLSYNEDLKITKRIQELNEKGVLSINYGSTKEEMPLEAKQKGEFYLYGLLTGIIITILLF